MRDSDKAWNTRFRQDAGRSTVRHRNRPVVIALTVLTVSLALAGLFVDLQLASQGLALACYTAAVLSGSILMAFLFVRKLWVTWQRG